MANYDGNFFHTSAAFRGGKGNKKAPGDLGGYETGESKTVLQASFYEIKRADEHAGKAGKKVAVDGYRIAREFICSSSRRVISVDVISAFIVYEKEEKSTVTYLIIFCTAYLCKLPQMVQ